VPVDWEVIVWVVWILSGSCVLLGIAAVLLFVELIFGEDGEADPGAHAAQGAPKDLPGDRDIPR
jgi:hypothetical protein